MDKYTVFINRPRPDADLDELRALAIRLVEKLDWDENEGDDLWWESDW